MNSNRTVLTVAFLLLSFTMWAQKNNFTLIGNLSNVRSGSIVYLTYQNPDFKKDSAIIQNGTFKFTGSIPSPVLAHLYLPHVGEEKKGPVQSRDFSDFYLEAGLIKANGIDSVKSMVITNSAVNDDHKKLKQVVMPLELLFASLQAEYKGAPDELKKGKDYQNKVNEKMIRVLKEINDSKLQFVKDNPDSYISLNLVFELARGRANDYRRLDTLYQSLSVRYKNTYIASQAALLISTGASGMVGSMARDFSQPDADGKIFRLSDFRGKYVMLEFWASWCGPCRKENPNLIRAYEKYKDKNFTVVSVSLDTKRQAWLDAVAQDKIPYLQLSELKGPQENSVAALYGIQSIPESYIIDPTGKIIAKNLRGDDLTKKLSELLK